MTIKAKPIKSTMLIIWTMSNRPENITMTPVQTTMISVRPAKSRRPIGMMTSLLKSWAHTTPVCRIASGLSNRMGAAEPG